MPTDGRLTFDDGVVQLGDDILPGIFITMDITAGVRFERAQKDHMSGKTAIPRGWGDADIKLTLDLLCDEYSDCYTKLSVINKIFKDADKGKANPRVYDVIGQHLFARGVHRVVFSGLDSRENDQEDVIQVVLAFSEYLPAVIKRETQASAKAKGKTAPATKAQPQADASITKDTTSPFGAGWNTGMNGGVR